MSSLSELAAGALPLALIYLGFSVSGMLVAGSHECRVHGLSGIPSAR